MLLDRDETIYLLIYQFETILAWLEKTLCRVQFELWRKASTRIGTRFSSSENNFSLVQDW